MPGPALPLAQQSSCHTELRRRCWPLLQIAQDADGNPVTNLDVSSVLQKVYEKARPAKRTPGLSAGRQPSCACVVQAWPACSQASGMHNPGR